MKKKLERKAIRLTTNRMQYLAKTMIRMLDNDKGVLLSDNIMQQAMTPAVSPLKKRIITISQKQRRRPRPA